MSKVYDSKSRAVSVKARLSKIALDKKIPYGKVATSFLIERLVARLVGDSELNKSLIFKGGYVSHRIYSSPRYTVDLDALVKGKVIIDLQKQVMAAVKKDLNDGAWFVFEKSGKIEAQHKYKGVRFEFRCGIGEVPKKLVKAQMLHLDLATGDSLYPRQKKIQTEDILSESLLTWQVYSAETIVAEKIHALYDRASANSRAKDVFDLYHLLPQCDAEELHESVKRTFMARDGEYPRDLLKKIETADLTVLLRAWAGLSSDLGIEDFKELYQKVCTSLRAVHE